MDCGLAGGIHGDSPQPGGELLTFPPRAEVLESGEGEELTIPDSIIARVDNLGPTLRSRLPVMARLGHSAARMPPGDGRLLRGSDRFVSAHVPQDEQGHVVRQLAVREAAGCLDQGRGDFRRPTARDMCELGL